MNLIRVYIQHVDTRSFVLYNLEVRSEYSYVVERERERDTHTYCHTYSYFTVWSGGSKSEHNF